MEEILEGRKFKEPVKAMPWPTGGWAVGDKKGFILQYGVGRLPIIILDNLAKTEFKGSEQGLQNFVLDPEFDEFPYLYVYYSAKAAQHTMKLSRFNVKSSAAVTNSELVILEIPMPDNIHQGGGLAFGADGMLYLAIGDGGPVWEHHGQRLETLQGSILRIDVRGANEALTYKVPSDNPFVSAPNARPEIWAYGLRNPWRMAFDPDDAGKIWVGDVGWGREEEITVVEAGTNHGWHFLEGTLCTSTEHDRVTQEDCGNARETTVPPIFTYQHDLGCAVIGGHVYQGSAIPWLKGAYVFADHCSARIWAIIGDEDSGWEPREIMLLNPHRRISSFAVDREGETYLVTFGGPILKLVETEQPGN